MIFLTKGNDGNVYAYIRVYFWILQFTDLTPQNTALLLKVGIFLQNILTSSSSFSDSSIKKCVGCFSTKAKRTGKPAKNRAKN